MSKKNFKVGDVVIGNFDDEEEGVVTRVDGAGNVYILWPDGSCGWHGDGSQYKKSGKFLKIEQCILSKLRSCGCE